MRFPHNSSVTSDSRTPNNIVNCITGGEEEEEEEGEGNILTDIDENDRKIEKGRQILIKSLPSKNV